jgi:hypothetical protein
MTLTITDHGMTSDRASCTARPPADRQHAWQVSWLPGRLMDRYTAVTAMIVADTAAAPGLQPVDRLWPHIQGWATELGLTAPGAITLASAPPDIAAGREPAPHPPDREAAGS